MRWLYILSLLATNSQLRYVPIESPVAVQKASGTPVIRARPGIPISSQPLISEASALMAVTSGPSFLPPKKKSLEDLLSLDTAKPIMIITAI